MTSKSLDFLRRRNGNARKSTGSRSERGRQAASVGRLAIVAWAIALASACGGGQSCACLKPIPGGFNTAKRIPNSIQARVSPDGIGFLQQNIGALIGSLIPGGLNFPIPPTCSGATQICCVDGGMTDPMCRADAMVTGAQLTPSPPGALAFTIRAILKTASASGPTMPVHATFIGITVDCDVAIDTTTTGARDLALGGRLNMTIDPRTGTTRMAVTDVTVADLDDGDINLSGGALCTIANLIKPLFIGTLTGELTGKVGGTINEQLCAKCPGMASLADECGTFATECVMGVCMQPAASGMGTECSQKLGMEGRLDLGAALASFAPGLVANADVYAVAGGYAESTNGGLNLGLLGGAEPAPAEGNPCVPNLPPPALPPMLAQSPTFSGSARAPVAHHLGIGIHKDYLNRFGWGIWKGGALCLNIGGASIAQLNSETFSLLAPSLADLVGDWPVPLYMQMRPQKQPRIELGMNQIMHDAMGMRTIQDAMLNVHLDDLQIEFSALVQDRYVRMFTVTANLTLPVALDVDSARRIVPVLGDVRNAVSNVRVTNSEQLEEDPTAIADTFPALLSIALPLITGGLKPIELPAIMGINLDIPAGGITSTDNKTFMAIFTNLQPAMPIVQPVETDVRLVSLRVPASESWAAGLKDRTQAPAARIAVGARDASGALAAGQFEWQYRINEGLWSPFQDATTLEIADAALLWQARHTVEVRARRVDERGAPIGASLSKQPAAVSFLIDTRAPRLRVESDGSLAAQDGVSATAELRWAFQLADGTFTSWTLGTDATASRAPAGAVAAHVADEAGNVSSIAITTGGAPQAPETEMPGASEAPVPARAGGGCSTGGSDGAGGLLALLLVGAALAFGRHRGMVALAAAALWAGGAGCSPDEVAGFNPEDGGAGRGGAGGAGGMATDGPSTPPPDAPPSMNTPGVQGRYSDLAVSGGKALVSGYEAKFGDLLVGEPGSDGKVAWRFADGVPDEPAVYPADSYRGGIRGDGDNVGTYTSIQIGADGRAGIAYHDVTHAALKFTRGADGMNRTFAAHAVDEPATGAGIPTVDTPFGTRVGMFVSLAYDAMGTPGIAYLATGLRGMGGQYTSELRFARASSASPAAKADWTVSVVDSAPIPCAGLCPSTEACIAVNDMMGVATKASRCQAKVMGCAPACAMGQACVMAGARAACTAEVPKPSALDVPEGTGIFPSLAFTSDGKTVIVYYARSNDGAPTGDLRLATLEGAMWRKVDLDGAGAMGADVGQFPSVAAAADGSLHVSYQDAGAGKLYYMHVAGGMPGMREVVDDGTRMDGIHTVGADSTIAVAGMDVRIVYQDQRAVDLMIAQKGMGAMWTKQNLKMGAAGNGYAARIVADGAMFWVSDFVYDRVDHPLGRVEVFRAP
jgi:hypothetical protein